MSLFSRKKKATPPSETKGGRSTVSLTCPFCSFNQNEASMAVSTYCRGCGSHYKINAGAAVITPPSPTGAFAVRDDDTPGENASHPERNHLENLTSHSATTPQAPLPRTRTVPPTTAAVKKAAAHTGFFQSKVAPREVQCFQCDKIHQAPAEASSTLCPACGSYIALKDYEIRGHWNSRIKTRGNVIIHKKATVSGITIHCHHLTVHGTLTAGVDCSGDFIMRNHGRITGKVRCKRLIIEKRANVQFINPVECEQTTIDGNVSGDFTCSGKLHLKKKATLTGDIKVATMAVDEGASHQGRTTIGH